MRVVCAAHSAHNLRERFLDLLLLHLDLAQRRFLVLHIDRRGGQSPCGAAAAAVSGEITPHKTMATVRKGGTIAMLLFPCTRTRHASAIENGSRGEIDLFCRRFHKWCSNISLYLRELRHFLFHRREVLHEFGPSRFARSLHRQQKKSFDKVRKRSPRNTTIQRPAWRASWLP